MATKQALLVYNPAAKTIAKLGDWLPWLTTELCERGHFSLTLFCMATRPRSDLIRLMRQNFDTVIAAGGDGTIRYVLSALAEAGTNTPLGIMPVGTANILARSLGVVDEAFFANPLEHPLEALLNGIPMAMDMGVMNGEYFGVTCGAGPLSDAFMAPDPQEKVNLKMLAYVHSMLQTIGAPPLVFSLTIDGTPLIVEASGVFVSNVEDLGLGRIPSLNDLTDGLLDVYVLTPQKLKDYMEIGDRFGRGIEDGHVPLHSCKAKQVIIDVLPVESHLSPLQKARVQLLHERNGHDKNGNGNGGYSESVRQKAPAMLDGEPCGFTPMNVNIAPRAVRVLVAPKRYVEMRRSPSGQIRLAG